MTIDHSDEIGWPSTATVVYPTEAPSQSALWSRRFRQRHADRVNAERREAYRKKRLAGASVAEARRY